MSQSYINFTADLVKYIHTVGVRRHPAQQALHDQTQKLPHSNMQSAPEVTALIGLLTRLIGAQNVLEIGTFTGYTTLEMALSVPQDGMVVTCEKSPDAFSLGKIFWEQASVSHKIDVQIGDALASMEKYKPNHFDLAFIDADKRNYIQYYEKCLSLVRPNGLILLDNILWKGEVANPDSQDKRVPTLKELNKIIHADNRVDACLVPISDGLTIVRKL